MRAQQLVKKPTGRSLPLGGRDKSGLLLGHLLTRCMFTKVVDDFRGKRIYVKVVLRNHKEQIAHYWHLIEDENASSSASTEPSD